jgi:hypothetical protein
MSSRGIWKLAGLAAAVACLAIPASAGAVVLHDQNSGGNGTGVFSQQDGATNFAELADDFTVTGPRKWTIKTVHVTGHYDFGTGPTTGVNVRIYSNAGSLPGTELFSQLAVTPSNGLFGPSFSIPLSGAPKLGRGTYWISVQALLTGYPANVWDWDNRAPQVGFPAAARTGFVPGCQAPNWGVRSAPSCIGFAAVPDQMFSLEGTRKCKKGRKFKKGKCKKKKKK